MSRAYCLTCNEQVTETLAGTCPSGHPVTTDDSGPEPWVGFVGDDTTTARPAPPTEVERPTPPLTRIGAAGEPVAHATNGSAVNGHASTHVNGNGRALGGGHGGSDPFPSTFGHRSSFTTDESAAPTERAPASGQASDDLAALLAEALGGDGTPPTAEDEGTGLFDHAPAADPEASSAPAAPEPATDPAPEPARTEDWGDLASLAAELQLDADTRDEGPAAADEAPTQPESLAPPTAEPVAPPPAPAPEPTVEPGDELAAADLDALMAELTGDPLPAEEDVVPQEPVAEPGPAEAPAAAMPPPTWDPTPLGDAPPPPEPVPSAPPATSSATPWDTPPAELEDPAAPDDPGVYDPDPYDPSLYDDVPDTPTPEVAEPVDLGNFTASGRRVGSAGTTGGSKKKTFGWKKR